MRRTTTILTAGCLVLAGLTAGAVAGAEELPPGFTDGQPVGAEPGPTGTASVATGAAAAVATAAATQRYFGAEAYAAVRSSVSSTSRSCTISDDGLTALALAPVFKESSAATTAATAPSPMTLSRYDEWTGILGTGNNQDANYSLYAARDPYTPYPRAFWHPGIGVWQYDSAGLGAPLTTIETMDTGLVGADVASRMAANYCNPSSVLIGHGAPFTDQERRYSAWRDWGYPCTLCQGFFDEMMNPEPNFANLTLVDGITPLGGTVKHTCTLEGVAGTQPCWYVDPSIGVIQGATAWATLDPTGGTGPTVAPTPLSYPFYVVDRGATEERHWLRADTGYAVDISASRVIGENARARSASGSYDGSPGLSWRTTSGLCDLTAVRGACVPVPPAGMSSKGLVVNGSYRPVPLDFDGDDRGDVFWYAPGSVADFVWLGQGSGAFTTKAEAVNGSYDDVVAGDLDGDGDDDVLWYQRTSGSAFLWLADGAGGHSTIALNPGKDRRPLMLDVDGDGAREILWYGPGATPDSLWQWQGSDFQETALSVNGAYEPVVGDLDGNHLDDVVWYAPGGGSDFVWLYRTAGGYTTMSISPPDAARPLVGDLDGDQIDDLLWYAAGSSTDVLWFGAPGGTFAVQDVAISGTYQPVVADLDGDGADDIFWYAPGTATDTRWRWSGTRERSIDTVAVDGVYTPAVGAFSTGGGDGVLWYAPGSSPDTIWYR